MSEQAILDALDFPLARQCEIHTPCPKHGEDRCPQDATWGMTLLIPTSPPRKGTVLVCGSHHDLVEACRPGAVEWCAL